MKDGATNTENGPVIYQDTREQRPLNCAEFLPVVVKTLVSGDYSIGSPDQPEGLGLELDFAIERKSLPDLIGSLTRDRERFERELHRLRGFAFARLLITACPAQVKAHQYRSEAKPAAILASLSAMECRYNVPVIWIADEREAARWICRAGWFFWRERARLFRRIKPCGIEFTATEATLQVA